MAEGDTLYDTDFVAWTRVQAEALRDLSLDRLPPEIGRAVDWNNLADELQSLGDSYRLALMSHLRNVLLHLLKLEFSPAEAPRNGWRRSVRNGRVAARAILRKNPSLKRETATLALEERSGAVELALGDLADHGEDAPERAERVRNRVYDLDAEIFVRLDAGATGGVDAAARNTVRAWMEARLRDSLSCTAETRVMDDPDSLYDTDFVAWTRLQAEAIRALPLDRLPPEVGRAIDWDNLAEEVEGLGTSQELALANQIRRTILHLLKLEFSPAEPPRNVWCHSVRSARIAVEDLLERNPSLRRELATIVAVQRPRAAKLALSDLQDHGEQSAAPSEQIRARTYDLDAEILSDWMPERPAPT